MVYDLIIIGGGPAGAAAAVYAGRKKLKTLLLAESFGGQSVASDDIQNWIGDRSISGVNLAKKLEDHARASESVEIILGKRATMVKKDGEEFAVTAQSGEEYRATTLIVVSGARRRTLNIPGEKEFSGKGVAYCATCDAPIFKGKTVAVIGGGNAGLEAVVDLLSYAAKVYLLVRSDAVKGDPVTFAKIKNSSRVETVYQAEIREILGDKFVKGLRYADTQSGDGKNLALDGVFVEIGSLPNSDFIKDAVRLNERGEIIIDHKTAASSVPGIWAAGDVSDSKYKQNNISVGDAIKAALSAYEYIINRKKLLN
ncbi:MAG: FAD-dependent oxidoreductase [Candidatus Niyogibacteria bacterium]|nr:FAD-dependent oxidoreductase [Candidatus Niyogibacteria bacterium]